MNALQMCNIDVQHKQDASEIISYFPDILFFKTLSETRDWDILNKQLFQTHFLPVFMQLQQIVIGFSRGIWYLIVEDEFFFEADSCFELQKLQSGSIYSILFYFIFFYDFLLSLLEKR